MNKKLKIYGIIFGLVYCFYVIQFFATETDDFKSSFMAGYNSVGEDGRRLYQMFDLKLEPKNGTYTFPDKLQNAAGESEIITEFANVKIRVENTDSPLWHLPLAVVNGILVFILLAGMILIPVLLYKIIHSVLKNNVFEQKNINRLRWLGYIALLFFLYGLLSATDEYLVVKNIVGFENYNIVFPFKDYRYLFLGFGTLIFAEILRISTHIKEENELTI